jgi:hypothetical protein
MRHSPIALLITLSLSALGCNGPRAFPPITPEERAGLPDPRESVPVVRILPRIPLADGAFLQNAVSGFALGSNRVLTALHGVADVPPSGTAVINTVETTFRVLHRGEVNRMHGDWALLETDKPVPVSPRASTPYVEFRRPLRRGELLIALGFPALNTSRPKHADEDGAIPLNFVDGRVLRGSHMLVSAEIDSAEGLDGLSGGPVVAWDNVHDRWVVVGLVRGTGKLLDGFREMTQVLTIVRPPPSVLEPAPDRSSTAHAPGDEQFGTRSPSLP